MKLLKEITGLTGFTKEEQDVINEFREGRCDGMLGNILQVGKSSVYTVVKNGIVTRYKEGPDRRFFNGKENEIIPGKLKILEKFVTDEELLFAARKYGWLTANAVVKAYSSKFKGIV